MPLQSLTSRARAAHRAPNGGKQPLPTLSRSDLTDLGLGHQIYGALSATFRVYRLPCSL
jgi:hypothetical protein